MAANKTAPKISELQDLVKTALDASPYFKDLSAKVADTVAERDPVTGDRSVVIADDGTKKGLIELRMRTVGFCVIVEPLIGWMLRGTDGPEWIFDAMILVRVKANQQFNKAGNPNSAGVVVVEACKQATIAICRYPRHPGGEFFKPDKSSGTLSQFDAGVYQYDLQFTKDALL